jgi:hypothetical protein
MNVKATLICEDVRLEATGALTLVGVANETLLAPQADGPIEIARVAFVVVVAGLHGVDRVGYRQHVQRVGAQTGPPEELVFEEHHPRADEHNFVFGPAALLVAGAGDYELVFELRARDQTLAHRYRFHLGYRAG